MKEVWVVSGVVVIVAGILYMAAVAHNIGWRIAERVLGGKKA